MSEPIETPDTIPTVETPPTEPAILHAFIADAVNDDASDIHIDPVNDDFVLRHRVDGNVIEKLRLAGEEGRRLLNQIRVASNLAIDIGHVPQEGRFPWWSTSGTTGEVGRQHREVRVTIIPTPKGQCAHLRLLQTPAMKRPADALGMTNEQLEMIEHAVKRTHGLALIGGRTGAGKTTTLYALAQTVGPEERVVVSVEDPIEFNIPAMRQIEVDEHHGMRMSDGLRVLMRTDPDVMMIGEVRDQMSASTAARAALTGRLVMATIHAPDAAGAFEAMHYHAVPNHVLGGALSLLVAQDLVRCLCSHCARPRKPDDPERQLFDRAGLQPPEELVDPVGCKWCGDDGYAGRTGVFEVACIDADTQAWLARGQKRAAIRQRLIDKGMEPIDRQALRRAARGVISISEAQRISGDRPNGHE